MILVAGGTGFLGRSITPHLLRQGEKVRVMGRDPEKIRRIFGSRVEAVTGDVRQPATLTLAVEGCDRVVHCVQFPNHPIQNPRKGYTYLAIDGQGTENVVSAVKNMGIQHFIYLSGAGAHPSKQEPWFRAKAMAENAVHQSGMPCTIIRPSWIFGPGDHSLNKFVLFAKFLPFMPVIGDGQCRIQPVYVEDIGRLVVRCLKEEIAKNQTIEIGGPETLTMDEINRRLLKVLGQRRFLLHHPKPFMKFIASFLQFLPGPPLNPEAVDFVTMDGMVDLTALHRLFPDFELTRFEEALHQYLPFKR